MQKYIAFSSNTNEAITEKLGLKCLSNDEIFGYFYKNSVLEYNKYGTKIA